MNILTKVKFFLWRAAKNLLPTVENLWKRKVVQEPVCHICMKDLKTISHALVDCKFARRHTHLAVKVQNDVRQDMLSMLQCLIKMLTTKEIELVTFVWWMVWNARTKICF